MPVLSSRPDHNRAENLVQQLALRLSQHVFWDALLTFLPPIGAVIYIVAVLFRTAWIGSSASLVAITAVVAAGIVGIILRYRPRVPGISVAARLADRQSGAKDHFLTLATVESGKYPLSFVSKLRREAGAFSDRIELKRDFPYRLKRSAYWSVGASLFAVMFIHFGLPMIRALKGHPALEVVRQLAQEMATKPDLESLGHELQAAASKLDDPRISLIEKQEMTQEMRKKIEEKQQTEQSKDNHDLLSQTADALQQTEQQLSNGSQGEKDQQKGGGIESNLSQKGQGQGKEGQGSGESKGNSSKAEVSADSMQGKEGQAKPNESGKEKNPQQSGASKDSNQPDGDQTNQEPNKQQTGKAERSKEGAGRQQTSDQPPPAGTSPADRFYAAGEGHQKLAGAGYVTVQLPEEIATDEKGESRPSKDSRASRTHSQVPVSNVPLPAHIPNAASEKQEIPIEYRGMIR